MEIRLPHIYGSSATKSAELNIQTTGWQRRGKFLYAWKIWAVIAILKRVLNNSHHPSLLEPSELVYLTTPSSTGW